MEHQFLQVLVIDYEVTQIIGAAFSELIPWNVQVLQIRLDDALSKHVKFGIVNMAVTQTEGHEMSVDWLSDHVFAYGYGAGGAWQAETMQLLVCGLQYL